jgi:hypothetical protein
MVYSRSVEDMSAGEVIVTVLQCTLELWRGGEAGDPSKLVTGSKCLAKASLRVGSKSSRILARSLCLKQLHFGFLLFRCVAGIPGDLTYLL